MAITPNLLIFSPTLQDFLIDKNGLPLSAGIITCYADNSRTTLKNWYYQTGQPGNYNYLTLPNPMVLSAAGTIQDFNGNDVIPGFYPYSELDAEVKEPYYITVDNSKGERQFTRANFPFLASGAVGPAVIPAYQNFIINNVFWRNIGSINATNLTQSNPYFYAPKTIYYTTLAPSQHDGFMIPDFIYGKDVNGTIETITFKQFPATNQLALLGDVTPEYYVELSTGVPVGETLKFFMFPICLHIKNLALQPFIATVQARVNNGIATTMTMSVYQSTGTGGSLGGNSISASYVLGNDWNQYELVETFPSAENITVGNGGDDGFYLVISFATSQAIDVQIAMPSLYLGATAPTNSFQTYDMVDSIANTPRTGDIRSSVNAFYPYGWVPMNDGTIGYKQGASSSNATARANADTWPLYNLLWQYAKPFDAGGGSKFNPICQMFDNAGATADYGTDAITDFNNFKALSLTKMFGKVLAGNVPVDALLPNVYSQTFTASNSLQNFTVTINTSTTDVTVTNGAALTNKQMIVVSSTSTLPAPLLPNTPYYIQNLSGNTFKLSSTQDGDIIVFSTNGVGTHSLNTNLCINVQNSSSFFVGQPVTVYTPGTYPGNLQAKDIYYVTNIAGNLLNLATSYQNALNGFPVIGFISAGSGTLTIRCEVTGITIGEYLHRLSIGEIPSHTHTNNRNVYQDIVGGAKFSFGGNSGVTTDGGNVLNLNNTGGNTPHNTMQPTTFYNVYIKL